MEKTTLETDILIVGGGLAGLCAALAAQEQGARITVAAKGRVGRSGNTVIARNGLAAVVAGGLDGDSPERHAEDTIRGGAGINAPPLVSLLADRAGQGILRLAGLGVPFVRDQNTGDFVRLGAPGHTRKRFLRVEGGGGKSGRPGGLALTLPLLNRLCTGGVTCVENVLIGGLLTTGGRATGAWGLSTDQEQFWIFRASAVILACGGLGRLFAVSTNAAGATGDGYALAHLAGARLRDMEFVQFHPVVTVKPPRTVISTALFADGAVLRNARGECFLERYSPQGNLATRDVMARACHYEIAAGRGSPGGGVYLDFDRVPNRIIQERYPELEVLLAGERSLEVAPAAHFMMGGVVIDDRGRTTLPGLFAAGETAGGVHGANRLAGNALTEAVVFGFLAGESACRETGNVNPSPANWEEIKPACGYRPGEGDGPAGLRRELQQTVGAGLSLVRTRKGLDRTLAVIQSLTGRLAECAAAGYAGLLAYHQARLMVTTAALVAQAALARPTSLGAHFRED